MACAVGVSSEAMLLRHTHRVVPRWRYCGSHTVNVSSGLSVLTCVAVVVPTLCVLINLSPNLAWLVLDVREGEAVAFVTEPVNVVGMLEFQSRRRTASFS